MEYEPQESRDIMRFIYLNRQVLSIPPSIDLLQLRRATTHTDRIPVTLSYPSSTCEFRYISNDVSIIKCF